jgi:hypothetical protein
MKFEAASLAASFNATRLAGRPRLLIGFAGIGLLLIVRREANFPCRDLINATDRLSERAP